MIRGGDVVKFSNSIELEIRGERALFRDPLRPQTLPVPSCEALKGILGSIYWNPDFIWVPDSLRVMNPSDIPARARGHLTEAASQTPTYTV